MFHVKHVRGKSSHLRFRQRRDPSAPLRRAQDDKDGAIVDCPHAGNVSEVGTSISRPLFSGTTDWGGRPMVGPTRRRDRQMVGETCGRVSDRESKRRRLRLRCAVL